MALATAHLSKPGSGRIISHNVHLLNDSYKDSETGSSSVQILPFTADNSAAGNPPKLSSCSNPLEMISNMGTESPGVAQPSYRNNHYRDSLEDNYDERPLSNSSADSRGMDDSPVDDQENSEAVLDTEKKYQDDLKERVRQSFKDLGMEPEGLLKDDPSRDPRGKKKHPRSRKPQDPDGYETDDNIIESSVERDNVAETDSAVGYATEASGHATEASGHATEASGHATEASGHATEASGHATEASDHANEPSTHLKEPSGHANEPSSHANEPSSHANEPSSHANEPSSHANEPSSHANEPSSHANEPSSHANDPSAHAKEPSAYSNEHEVTPDKPLHTDTSQEHPSYSNPQQEEVGPKEYPSDMQQQNANAAKEYPNHDGSGSQTLPEFPSQQYVNDSPEQDQGGHEYSDVMPDHHKEAQENSRPDERNLSSQENRSTSLPVADEQLHDDNRRVSGVYPDDGDYGQGVGLYPDEGTGTGIYRKEVTSPEGGPTQPVNVPSSDGRDVYPKATAISSGYPSRYANQEYDDDEQYNGLTHFEDRPQDTELYHESPQDSLNLSEPGRHPHTNVLADSLEYDENDNSAKDVIPYHHEPGDFVHPWDSSDLRIVDTVSQAHPIEEDRHEEMLSNPQADNDISDPAPYDSLEGEPTYDHNKSLPEALELDTNINSTQERKHDDMEPGYQLASDTVQKDTIEDDAGISNSGSSKRELHKESSSRSRKASESRRPSGTEGPDDRRKTSSPRGSGRIGSRSSNRQSYVDMARQQGSAKHRSAASDKSDESDQRQHLGSSRQQSRSSSKALREQNRSRSQSNRMKTSPIPADELSAKELLKRARTKSDVAREQAVIQDSGSQIVRKNREAVQVAYISDDSGDEGEHFVDEKGSPINHFGKRLYKDHHEIEKLEEPKLEFRIKPTPPKQKSPLELQAVNARRTSAEMDNRTGPNSGKMKSNPFPVEEPLIEKTAEVETGLLDSAQPAHYGLNEPAVQKIYRQQEGTNGSTLPGTQDRSSQKEDPETPGAGESSSRRPFGEVKVRSVGTIMSGKSLGRGRTPPVSQNNREEAYEEFQHRIRQHSGMSLGGIEKDFDKPDGYPSVSRGASGGSYQERGSQYTPQEGQSRGFQGQLVHQAYNPQGYPIQHYYHDQDSSGYPAQQSWEQLPQGIPWNSPHLSQMPQFSQGAHYIQPQPGYDGLVARTSFHHSDQGQYFDQRHPYETGYRNYHQPGPTGLPQGYLSPSMDVFQSPNQGMQPVSGNYPDQTQTQQRGPPKPKPNFIDLNKANLARGPPRKKYSDIQKQRLPPTRMNPTKPLPDITQEALGYHDPVAGDINSFGSAQTWTDENWTRQLIQEQQTLPLRRGHSDTNLYQQNAVPGTIQVLYHPQGMPVNSMPGHDQSAFQPGYNQAYPPQPRHQNGQPYSYSADHATQFARNMRLPHQHVSGPPPARVAFADDYRNSFDSDVNPMTFANEGAGTEYQHATRRTSPYPVLPDISGHDRTDSTSPLRKSDPDSYVARLLKQKEPPQYKEYTIKDYRKLKMGLRLGGLGPDPELISERQEKVTRQRDYAKTVMEQNKKQLVQQVQKVHVQSKEESRPKDSTPSKREIAKEYARKVPKPRMPTPPEVLHKRMYGASSRQQTQQESEHEERTASEMLRLEELKARHRKEKEEVERLRVDTS